MFTKQEARQLRKLLEKQTESLNDSEALEVATFVKRWKPKKEYKEYDRVSILEGDTVLLYKCGKGKGHISNETNKPSIHTASIWTKIDIEHTGTIEDPIPYSINMELFKDKYYIQYDVVYLCIESTQTAVFSDLKDLPRYCTAVSQEGGVA